MSVGGCTIGIASGKAVSSCSEWYKFQAKAALKSSGAKPSTNVPLKCSLCHVGCGMDSGNDKACLDELGEGVTACVGMATVPVWHGKRSPGPRETHTDTATDTVDTRVCRLRLAVTAVHTAIEFGLGFSLLTKISFAYLSCWVRRGRTRDVIGICRARLQAETICKPMLLKVQICLCLKAVLDFIGGE
ncbi:hypothetical protein B0H14DRAFT_2564647 [Mycena olivaceomarginata]|nr:hypothetical protein B0H14DRAFT_2564647 [Mycena olivaceomarginata]